MRHSGTVALLLALLTGTATAQSSPSALPQGLEEVGLEQRVGERVDPNLELIDHRGQVVRLGDLLGDLPVLIAPVYFDCPMLCSLTLEGMIKSLRAVSLTPGADFHVLAVSFDPRETPEQAASRRRVSLQRYGRDGADEGFHFLTGRSAAVSALMEQIGFRTVYDEESGEFSHVSTIVVVTPDGVVSRYFPGIEYPPRDVRLSLVEAADEQIGTVVDKVLLYCFRYDPTTGKYTAATMNLIRAGGVLTLLLMGAYVIRNLRREQRRRATAGAGA